MIRPYRMTCTTCSDTLDTESKADAVAWFAQHGHNVCEECGGILDPDGPGHALDCPTLAPAE